MLMTYDLRTQPWAVGDMLTFHAACLCLSKKYDVRLVYDEVVRPPHFDFVPHPAGAHLELMKVMANAVTGVKTVSIGEHSDWPRDSSRYMFYSWLDDVMYPVWQERKSLPRLRTKHFDWAVEFHKKHGTRGIINIRRHPNLPNLRDAVVPAWAEFIDKLPERVIQIGDVKIEGAIHPEESADRQIALIDAAKWMMGSVSGPMCMSLFNNKPGRFFAREIPPTPSKLIVQNEQSRTWLFAPNHKEILGVETPELLRSNYDEIMGMLQ